MQITEMKKLVTGGILGGIFCLLTPLAEAAPEISIASLYTDPALLGSPPEVYEWCPDNKHLAFVWQEKSNEAAAVWMYSVSAKSKSKLSDSAVAKAEKQAAISELQCLNRQQLAYVAGKQLYLIKGKGKTLLLQEHKKNISQLSVAPDGRSLAYLVDGELWVRKIDETKNTATLVYASKVGKLALESYQWSADSSKFAFVERDLRQVRELELHYDQHGKAQVYRAVRAFPGDETPKRRLGIMAVRGGPVLWLARENDKDKVWGYGWSADSRAVFVDSTDFLIDDRTILVYDSVSGESTVHYSAHDPQRSRGGWSAAWAPADKGLIILSDHEGYYHLYHQPQAGAELRALTQGEWEIADFRVDSRNKTVYFTANREHAADRQLYSVAMHKGAKVKKLSSGPGTYEAQYAHNFRTLAYRFSDDSTPADLYVADLRGGKPARVTHSPLARFSDYQWAEVRYVNFPSHVDGTQLIGRMYLPRDFDKSKKYPLIMGSSYRDSVRNQWGGSQNSGGSAPHPTWGLDQVLVENGYIVMNVDVRGSWGHGRAFRDALKEYGSIDIDDIESGVRHLVAKGYVDATRVGIWGLSYGGLMTTMSLFKKPEVYAAGVAGAPATNVWHAYPEQMWVMGEPHGADYPGRYERQSAVYQAAGLQDPLMLIHGTRDIVVLYSDTINLVEKLIADNRQFELVTLPGGNHPWANDNLAQTRFAFSKMLAFFNRHLQP